MSEAAQNRKATSRAIDRAKLVLIALCLFAPSAWMIATIPPLWRDADAYVQLTQDPRVATFWGHAPAYCYVAKIPLFAGEQWERMRGQPPAPRIVESQPALTDSGIWILIVAQHLALGGAALRFITAISTLFSGRLALALVWASNAFTYTFAHCVGSETLGLILVIVLVTSGFRLVLGRDEPRWTQWLGFAVLLLLCIESRELNLALIAVLPLAFLISWLREKISRPKEIGASRTFALRNVAIAFVIGLACPFVVDSLEQDLARKTKLHPHSRIGFTFLWRLHSLNELSPEARAALLQKVRARAPTERVRYLVTLLEQSYAESPDIGTPKAFMERGIEFFGGHLHWEELDEALNQMALTFLWPPLPELSHAARADFLRGVEQPSTAISKYLFATTTYYFGNKEEIPGCGRLVTFRDGMSPAGIMHFSLHPYFNLWQGISWLHALGVWVVALLLLSALAIYKQKHAADFIAYGTALLFAGVVQFVVSCVLHDYEPRFSFAIWLLLFCSFFVLVAGATQLLIVRKGSPPGSHCRAEP